MNFLNIEILFAEDSLDDATLTKHALEKSGLFNKIHHVENGAEVLDLLNGKIFIPRAI